MDPDELSYNWFYVLLRNEYRKKYDFALTKCWTICVPCIDALRDVSISKEFVDDHILRPHSNGLYVSTGEEKTHLYKIENNTVTLMNESENHDDYQIKILSVEKGYNKEFQPYSIIVLDKPIHRKYNKNAEISEVEKMKLNRSITSYTEAVDFLKDLLDPKPVLLNYLATAISGVVVCQQSSIDNMKQVLQKLIREHWMFTMRSQSLDIQRDARFQKLLSTSIEMFVMYCMHDKLYYLLSKTFEQQDLLIRDKIDELIDIDISPDQLGIEESLVSLISLPCAMVELATLDCHKGPLEKLMCLKGTLDFIVAEIKGAVADVQSKEDYIRESNSINYVINTDNLIPLVLYVIIKCRCQKLYTDLFYVENFIWSIDPHDGLSYTLVTFKAALSLLEQINIDNLPNSKSNVLPETGLNNLLKAKETHEQLRNVTAELKRLCKDVGMRMRGSEETEDT